MVTRLEIIKRLQARIGDEPITAEDDAGADTHIAIYEDVQLDLLSRYPWQFNQVTRRLGRLTAVPDQHYEYYFQMPADMIGAPRAFFRDRECRHTLSNFQITENRVAADAEEIYIKFNGLVPPAQWPGFFRELFNVAVMSEFALSIREDGVLSDRLRLRAFGTPAQLGEGGLFAQAKNMDAQSHSQVVLSEGSNPLIDVRTS